MTTHATVQMWGNTRAVRIPKAMAQEIGLDSGTRVTLTLSSHGLIVKPVRMKKIYKLSRLLAQCKRKNPHRQAITGRAGNEIF